MKQEEPAIIYNKIKEQSGLTDEALTAVGVTKDRIDIAYSQLISKGVTPSNAIATILRMWENSDPDVKQAPATSKEMVLMGFVYSDGAWTHSKYKGLQYTKELVRSKSFREIEQAVEAMMKG